MKFISFFLLFATFAFCSEFITKSEYAKMLYQNPRGIGCHKCHGDKGEGALMVKYKAFNKKSNKYEEDLIIKGTQGKMLRSKSEAIIDMMLYKNKIPFRYEEKLVLDEITLYPDFVIRHPATGESYYWEHFGMMDEEDYMDHACDKIRLYCKNGIIPSLNLITTYETKRHPLSVEKVESIIQEYF